MVGSMSKYCSTQKDNSMITKEQRIELRKLPTLKLKKMLEENSIYPKEAVKEILWERGKSAE